MKRSSKVLFAIANLSVFASASLVSAQQPVASEPPSCGSSGRPGIVLRADDLEPGIRAEVREQLRAALGPRDFSLCEEGATSGAVAVLDLSSAPSTGVMVTLTVRDDVTDKKVSRDLDLRRIPADGRALVIALAADELLRASWAELLVADAPKPKREVPVAIVRAVPPPESPTPIAPTRRQPRVEVGAAFALEHFGGGHDQLGLDFALSWYPTSRLGLLARGGPRSSARVSTTIGDVSAAGFAVGLGSTFALLPRGGPAGLDMGAEMFVSHVSFDASAEPNVVARDRRGTALHVSLIARGWVVLVGPLRANLGLAIGAPLHGVRATGDDRTLAAATGILLGGHLGVGGAW